MTIDIADLPTGLFACLGIPVRFLWEPGALEKAYQDAVRRAMAQQTPFVSLGAVHRAYGQLKDLGLRAQEILKEKGWWPVPPMPAVFEEILHYEERGHFPLMEDLGKEFQEALDADLKDDAQRYYWLIIRSHKASADAFAKES